MRRAIRKAADTVAINSKDFAYKDNLPTAALFLRHGETRRRTARIAEAHLGNQMVKDGKVQRIAALIPGLRAHNGTNRSDRRAALGGRVHVDLWNDNIELIKKAEHRAAIRPRKIPPKTTLLLPHEAAEASAGDGAAVIHYVIDHRGEEQKAQKAQRNNQTLCLCASCVPF